MRDTLQVKGYQTIEAETGEEGVRLAHERQPALILMDIQLPGINGIEACIRCGLIGDTRYAGHRHYGLRDDPRPHAHHGCWIQRFPGKANQRPGAAGDGTGHSRHAFGPALVC